jgi:uncharacterized protein (TIGR02145 family)
VENKPLILLSWKKEANTKISIFERKPCIMKTATVSMVLSLCLFISAVGQKVSLELTFTAINDVAYVQLDSIKLLNRSQGGEFTAHWPDTTISVEITAGDTLLYIGYSALYPVGIINDNQQKEAFQLFRNYPNPIVAQSVFSIYLPEDGPVKFLVTDPLGRVFTNTSWTLGKGLHSFRITPFYSQYFFITATWHGISRSMKVLSSSVTSGSPGIIEYIGSREGEPLQKESTAMPEVFKESGILDTPLGNKTYSFQFACNTPCLGLPTVEYEGQIYHTIQINSQCWLRENLNVGTRIPASDDMTDNNIIEKYCYEDNPDYCLLYGGLYQWKEAMQYSTQQGTEGICPPGWHIPTDEEWKVLEGTVDSETGIGETAWDWLATRGYDAGKNLKSTSGWHNNGNGTDLFGFTALPGGRSSFNGYFYDLLYDSFWWTSTEESTTTEFTRELSWGSPGSTRYRGEYRNGYSIRCIQN